MSEARERVYDALVRVLDAQGVASARDVAAEAGLASHSTALRHLGHLADDERVIRPVNGKACGWRLPAPAPLPTAAPASPTPPGPPQPRDTEGRWSSNRVPAQAMTLDELLAP